MSYDVWVEVEVTDSINHTSNTAGMWEKGLGMPLCSLEGMQCRNALVFLDKGIEYMESNPEELEPMNPDNGWGSYDSALGFLRKIRSLCLEWPNGILHMSC